MLEARRQFKRLNPRNTPSPIDLQREWGKYFTLEWVTKQIQNQIEDVGIDSNITEDESNMSRGCERKVQLEFYRMLFPYNFDTINYFNINHYFCFNLNKWYFTRKTRRSFDCGIMVDFKQFRRSCSKDKNIIEQNLQYVGKIQEIIELDYFYFQCSIFECRWY